MVKKVDREAGSIYIIEEIDQNTCLVREQYVDELKRKVKQLMDDAMGAVEEDDDKDSDLD
jgi:hypothetical protein